MAHCHECNAAKDAAAAAPSAAAAGRLSIVPRRRMSSAGEYGDACQALSP